MANKYRGFVEFDDPEDGQKYVLRLGTHQYLAVQAEADKLEGRAWQRFMFHQALIHGTENQREMTLEDATEIVDDLGYLRVDELLNETRFGKNAKAAADEMKRRREEAERQAATTIGLKIKALKHGVTDPAVLKTLDDVAASLEGMTTGAGSANPPAVA